MEGKKAELFAIFDTGYRYVCNDVLRLVVSSMMVGDSENGLINQ